ncbi:TPR end-of-group domain-containing protein [Roseimaritima ulvae]|uniref:Tetratricopeptide repeat protein n=1 Tax=Roseimaritima ulvae TaxID=980254 RepID=A0A5B9QN63_9BACT|nr:tetratricopeptide repeat protein [Roseimaritima ulvae]QEG38915.1 Tetratricopeptide repeat protein [Roseimaritima ulvae]
MNDYRFQSRQKLEEAEGYLQLITSVAAKLGLRRSLRRRLALKALRTARDAQVPADHAWRRLLVMGQCLRLLGRHSAAANCLWKAARRQPKRPPIWIALGWSLRRAGRLDQAITAVTRGLLHTPDNASLHFNLACYLAAAGQAEEAVTELVWALDIEPELRRRIDAEADFDRIRFEPAFQAISQLSV